ncbi:MAG: helix-turn-helix domain-containing protein [Phycisphaerae bacterium]
MNDTLTERLTRTPEGMRLYQQERAIQELTDLACELMKEQEVSRSELAQRLGKTKGYITQLLDGSTNMTVRTISDLFTALDRALHFQDGPMSATVGSAPMISLISGVDWMRQEDVWRQSDIGMDMPIALQERLAI